MRFLMITAAIVSCFAGCGEQTSTSQQPVKKLGQRQVVAEGGVEVDGLSLSGTGTVKFVTPLAAEARSSRHVGLEFSKIDPNTPASLTLVTFADRDLGGGIEFHLDESSSYVRTAVEGGAAIPLTGSWAKPRHLRFDIHNNESPAHVIVWDLALSSSDAGEGLELFDSGELSGARVEAGKGTFVGIRLQNVTVRDFLITEAIESDHDDHDHDDHDHDDHDHDDHDHDGH